MTRKIFLPESRNKERLQVSADPVHWRDHIPSREKIGDAYRSCGASRVSFSHQPNYENQGTCISLGTQDLGPWQCDRKMFPVYPNRVSDRASGP